MTTGADVATVTTWNYSGVSRFDVYGGWTSGAPLSRGTIFTDRQMYQPGERGEITGVAYYVKGERVVADANALYNVTLADPSNNATPLGQAQDRCVRRLLDADRVLEATGARILRARGARAATATRSTARCASREFKPPNFKLKLTLGAASATAGSSVTRRTCRAPISSARRCRAVRRTRT